MRRQLLIVMCCLLCTALFAAPVSREQAQEMAAQFVTAKGKVHRAPSATELKAEVVLNAVDQAGHAYLYAVNLGQQNGFVLVSGDDRARDILGYADSGQFDPNNIPDNMKAWLQFYIDELKSLDNVKAVSSQGAASTLDAVPMKSSDPRKAGLKTAISPLLPTLWDQGSPYNNNCPDFFTYGKSVTGCLATAMAQVMYYTAVHSGNRPEQTLVEIPAYDCTRNWTGLGRIHVDAVPAGTVLDWNNMALTYNGSSTSVQDAAVATLMQACGAALNMDYSTGSNGGSSAYNESAPDALKTYFGYDETTRLIYRSSYSLAAWTEIVYGELAAKRPVLYGGQSSGGGHAFVVDGYDGDELFHVNWGWSGSSNGYFALSVLNPGDNSGIGASTSNDGYSFGQNAVIGIQIGSGETYEEEPLHMSTGNLSVDGKTIIFSAFNHTGSTNSFYVGIGFIDDEGNVDVIDAGGTGSLDDSWGYSAIKFNVPDDATKKNQTLKIVPISALTTGTRWIVDVNYALTYVEAVYDADGKVTLTAHPIVSLEATSISFTGSKFKDEAQPVEVAIKNDGDEYYGVFYLFASTTSSKGEAVNKGGLTVVKGGTASLTFEFTPETTGTYNIWVATDADGENVIGQSTVTISVNPSAPTGEFMIASLSIADADGTSWTTDSDGTISVDVYSKDINFDLTAKNISEYGYNVQFQVALYKQDGASWNMINCYTFGTVALYSGYSVNLLGCNFGEQGYGKYKVALLASGITYDERYVINAVMGYNTLDKAGNVVRVKTTDDAVTVAEDVAAIDLSGFDFSSITPNSNPNTLYILSDSQTAPATLTGKNVVKDGVADKITLTDGYAFCSPIDFTATEISYSRIFDTTEDGTNWNTLVLPFAPTKVSTTVDGMTYDLSWFSSASDTNKNFWLMKYSGEGGSNKVNFDYVDGALEANTPYILALPGDSYGSKWSLKGCTIDFEASNALIEGGAKSVVAGSQYKFVGTTAAAGSKDNIYVLNSAGTHFDKGTAAVSPFRAYFSPTSTQPVATSLGIGIGGSTTGVFEMEQPQTLIDGSAVYDLSGRKLDGQLSKGLYIKNGKKYVVK